MEIHLQVSCVLFLAEKLEPSLAWCDKTDILAKWYCSFWTKIPNWNFRNFFPNGKQPLSTLDHANYSHFNIRITNNMSCKFQKCFNRSIFTCDIWGQSHFQSTSHCYVETVGTKQCLPVEILNLLCYIILKYLLLIFISLSVFQIRGGGGGGWGLRSKPLWV